MRALLLVVIALFGAGLARAASQLPAVGATKVYKGKVSMTSPIKVPGLSTLHGLDLTARVTHLAGGRVRFQSVVAGLPTGRPQTLDVIGRVVQDGSTLQVDFDDEPYRLAFEGSFNDGIRGMPVVGQTRIPVTSASASTRLTFSTGGVDVDTTSKMRFGKAGGFALKLLIPGGEVTAKITGRVAETN